MGDDLATKVAEAERRGERSLRTEPRAHAARYDRRTGRVHVDLTNGCSFAFPARNAQGLERASDTELAQVEILGLGLGLHWERLDVDLSVPGRSPDCSAPRPIWTASARRGRGRQRRPRRRRLPGATAQRAVGRARQQEQ